MNKSAIYALLKQRHLWHEITEHPAVYNMVAAAAVDLPYPEAEAKNLLVCDAHHQTFFLLTVQGEQRVDLKAFRRQFQTPRLTFATAAELQTLLGVIPGAVTPLGLLNDATCRVHLFIDQAFLAAPGLIGVHPNDNTATVWLKTPDLMTLIRHHGNSVTTVDFSALIKIHQHSWWFFNSPRRAYHTRQPINGPNKRLPTAKLVTTLRVIS